MSWFRSSQPRPEEPDPAKAPPPAVAAEEDAAEAAGLEPLTPPAGEVEPERPRSSTAPLDFFSLDPLDDEWDDSDEEEEEEDEKEEDKKEQEKKGEAPARTPSSRSRSRSRRGRASAPAAGLEDRSLADLHALAREAGIERYRLLKRPELIAKLQGAGGAGDDSGPPDVPAPARRDGSRERGSRRRGGRGRDRDRERRGTGEGRGGRDRDDQRGSGRRERPEEEQVEVAPAELERLDGLLELMSDGFGFVRVQAPVRSDRDPYLSREQVERFGLRAGDRVAGTARPSRRSERNPSVVEVVEVNGRPATEGADRGESFSGLPALPPSERLSLEGGPEGLRMLEIVTPLGKGHRALVHGAGGAGATTLLRGIAESLSTSPVHVIVAVIDARPEEIGAWQSSGAELFATSAEHAPADQVRAAGLALERSKRLVEEGAEVVLVVDSLTRLARAHGLAGRGDSEATPVHEVKRLFAAARSTGQGSLTVIAAARSDGDAALDTELREALAQIANVELRLDAELADAGLYPAIDVAASRTRGEEALVDDDERARLDALRGPARALEGTEEAWRYIREQVG